MRTIYMTLAYCHHLRWRFGYLLAYINSSSRWQETRKKMKILLLLFSTLTIAINPFGADRYDILCGQASCSSCEAVLAKPQHSKRRQQRRNYCRSLLRMSNCCWINNVWTWLVLIHFRSAISHTDKLNQAHCQLALLHFRCQDPFQDCDTKNSLLPF